MLLDGLADVASGAKKCHAYSSSEIVAQYNTHFYHWRGAFEFKFVRFGMVISLRILSLSGLNLQPKRVK